MAAALPGIETIFCHALEIADDHERSAYLDLAAGEDPELRREVESLLEARSRAGHFLECPAVAPTAIVEQPAPREGPAAVIGPYVLLERIGEGGMGDVWMADQLKPIRRTVALKIIKAGMDTKQVVARFEAERQALALMDHPNIARVLDAGATDSGRPYFVMEHVKGIPITTYCDEHRLSLRQRLELFLPVCRAIQHAHQKGIIHRDVKPSNVLIALYDGRPVPKVIDFGVAKATGRRLTERTLYTGFGSVVGTLEYMSPEQAELNNQDIDTRSDVYSLGVLLYELLTGTTPINQERLTQAAFTDMLRAVREEEPPKPSTRLSVSKKMLPAIAEQRHTEPARLPKLVHGELDWIVMKCLEKDRNRRYDTANDLALDVRRYLADEPLRAGPPTVGHRLWKLARRHRRSVVAAGLVALALIAGAIGTTWGLVRAERARGALKDQRDRTLAAERDRSWGLALSQWKEARIARAARQPGQRWRSLDALAAAARELRSLGRFEASRAELRDDAIASLTLWDVRLLSRLPGAPGLPAPAADPLGRHYVSVDSPGLISLRSQSDGRVLRRWQLEGGVLVGLDFSPDGRHIWGDCHDGPRGERPVARVWDTASGELILQRPIRVGAHDFRPDGKVLALEEDDGSIGLYELGTHQKLPSLPARPGPDVLRFDPGGRYLAVAFDDTSELEVWDLAAKKVVFRHVGADATLAWSPDGTRLALASDADIIVLTFPGGTVDLVLRGHEHVVTTIRFHSSGRLLASSSWDHTTRLWSLVPGGELVMPGERLAGFSRDGGRLETTAREGDNQWELLDPGGCVRYLPYGADVDRGPWGIAFAPDGQLLASASMKGVLLWDAATGRRVGLVPSGWGYCLAFSPDGSALYTTGPGGVMRWPVARDRGGRVLRLGPGTVVRAADSASWGIRMSVAGPGRALVLGAQDGGLEFVPLAEPGKARRLGIDEGLDAVALSPDGRWAASSCRHGGGIRVWDVVRGAVVHRLPLEGSSSNFLGATFSPDGGTLVTGDSSEFGFWDVGSWERVAALPRGPRSQSSLVAFARDGRLLALGQDGKRIELYNAATRQRLGTLELPAGPAGLTGLGLSPDGTRLAATTDRDVVALWDLRRLRRELAAIDLDWEMPPYPAAESEAHSSESLTVEVLPATTSPR
jgi:serine/threonine protein kinase/WD40 repeat protein